MDIDVNTLVERIQNGDESAFEPLSQKYAALTESTVRRFLPSLGFQNGAVQNESAVDPDELKQDMFLALYKAAMTYDPNGTGKKVSFGLYAKICMNNAMITKVRKYKCMQKRMERGAGQQAAQGRRKRPSSDAAWQGLGSHVMSDSLKEAVKTLSLYERRVFERYMEGKSIEEIAAALNRTEKSVSNACYRVKTKIREFLKNQ